ncbi:hypothetical protein H072_6134 [Dactylellina haptotyla CBS 200.50]|uniref:Uncharacterized protein n=1 Tax=Dactylellina haptotyla (strain CBS 200.50) TaxID=1284197 RepID=S8BKV8_DACHA|nr:hypothetical protein H072_6134 [Dactylellina haptotyla CBS 200.50]
MTALRQVLHQLSNSTIMPNSQPVVSLLYKAPEHWMGINNNGHISNWQMEEKFLGNPSYNGKPKMFQ